MQSDIWVTLKYRPLGLFSGIDKVNYRKLVLFWKFWFGTFVLELARAFSVKMKTLKLFFFQKCWFWNCDFPEFAKVINKAGGTLSFRFDGLKALRKRFSAFSSGKGQPKNRQTATFDLCETWSFYNETKWGASWGAAGPHRGQTFLPFPKWEKCLF